MNNPIYSIRLLQQGFTISRLAARSGIYRLCCRRHMLTPSSLGLGQFQQQVEVVKKRLGSNAAEFKTRLLEKIGSPDTELLTKECLSYIYLMNQAELPNAVKILERHTVQYEEDLKVGIPIEKVDLLTDILRQCHIHSSTSTALEIYRLGLMKASDITITQSLLVLSMLYNNRKYESCADITNDVFNSKLFDEITDMEYLQAIFALGFLSAFKMDSVGGLGKASRLLSDRLKEKLHKMKAFQKCSDHLLALYCLKQKRVNATQAILRAPCSDISSYTVNSNIKAMAHMQSDQVTLVFSTLCQLENAIQHGDSQNSRESVTQVLKNEAEASQQSQFLVFSDVFKKLINLPQQSSHHELVNRIRRNMSAAVHEHSVEEYLINLLTASVHSFTLSHKIIEGVGDFINEDDDDNKWPVTGTNSDSTQKHSSTSSISSAKSRGELKMKLVNGYIVFAEETA